MDCKQIFGHQELKTKQLWRAVVAEFIGTLFLVFIGCGACVTTKDVVTIALTFGLAVAILVQSICHVSGGHINPAVTLGMLVSGKISLCRAFLHIVVQCIGAICGSGLLKFLSPLENAAESCISMLGKDISPGKGVGVEIFITFVLVLTICAVFDQNRSDVTGSAPITIGLAITANHLFAIKYTGASMNPARSFGPALISNIWIDHWVYWVGPCIGGIASGIFYQFVLSATAPLVRQNTDTFSSEDRSKQDGVSYVQM